MLIQRKRDPGTRGAVTLRIKRTTTSAADTEPRQPRFALAWLAFFFVGRWRGSRTNVKVLNVFSRVSPIENAIWWRVPSVLGSTPYGPSEVPGRLSKVSLLLSCSRHYTAQLVQHGRAIQKGKGANAHIISVWSLESHSRSISDRFTG
jgi:hypothetical protein